MKSPIAALSIAILAGKAEAFGVHLKKDAIKAEAAVKAMAVRASVRQMRSPFWFEKFDWFVTSANHLVVSARDAQQARSSLRPSPSPLHEEHPPAPQPLPPPPRARHRRICC